MTPMMYHGTRKNSYLNESIVLFNLPSEFFASELIEERKHLQYRERDNRVSELPILLSQVGIDEAAAVIKPDRSRKARTPLTL
jgi:hypothetical protein